MSRRRGAPLVALTLALVTPTVTAAQAAGGDVAVERMRLASTREGIIGVEAGAVPGHLAWELGGWLGWSKDPLVLVRRSDGARAGSLVENRLGGSLVGALGLWGRGAVAVELPVVLYQDRAPGDAVIGPLDRLATAAVGAPRVVPRWALLRSAAHGIDLSVGAGLRLPVGSSGSFVASSSVEVEPEIAASRTLGRWRVAANVGAVARRAHDLASFEAGSEIAFQLGLARRLPGRAGLPAELQASLGGALSSSRPLSREEESALEARAAAAWELGAPVRLLAGTGVGLTEGWGAPAWRVFVAAQLAPRRAPPAPPPVEPAPAPAQAPEPPAPPPAPAEPPPPPDGDGDGILDADDRCREEPGPPENGGCPDRDGDRDGLADRLDACPDVAGPAETQGCPRSGAVRLTGERIEVQGTVYFDVNRDVIQARSYELLDSVAAVIVANPDAGRIRVEGHTDASGARALNLDLSRRRAAAVVRYLAGKGVDPARLGSAGHGPDRPVADNATADGRARNRRVEFHVEPPSGGQP